ncbi:LacI family DNA-binding transcriptional regulator [Tuberibacillus sp. Marseille-P3662]|uniref:LacI family DNA-binding transcriptional regulator n=1 Tax=Tuberibacillus sp. Marseille-P3662 TaxID=1965358 RepID=UPI000A1CAA14|nr:LacI family DNA-binding transcriptional regulator [Tuberibacillus sp. Marseille-P3662]
MKPTIYDVAKEANVSIATVSKVINGTGRIGEKTRRKVLLAMKELNYHPSLVASALTGKKTGTIGLLIPDISNPFYAELAKKIEDRSHELGLSVVMCNTDYDEEKEEKYISLLIRKNVDGVIFSSGFKTVSLIQDIVDQNIPVALLAQEIPRLALGTVAIDDYLGGYEAMNHLLSLGHKNVAIIAENVHSSDLRLNAYRDALKEVGIDVHDQYIVRTNASISNGKSCADHFFNLSVPPTAIFACNDLLAAGVMQMAGERGIKVPEELSISGFDNTILSTSSAPTLTTIAQPTEEMGNRVVDMLVEEIQGKGASKQRIKLLPELIIRGSTASPKGN